MLRTDVIPRPRKLPSGPAMGTNDRSILQSKPQDGAPAVHQAAANGVRIKKFGLPPLE